MQLTIKKMWFLPLDWLRQLTFNLGVSSSPQNFVENSAETDKNTIENIKMAHFKDNILNSLYVLWHSKLGHTLKRWLFFD